MIPQLVNILGGALLVSPIVSEKLHVTEYQPVVGVAVLILAVFGLIERLGLPLGFLIGGSYPQVVPALLIGLILAAPLLNRYPFLAKLISIITPFRMWIGVIGIVIGVGSLLVGCIFPVCFAL